jgi:hypothetical protein
VHYGIILREEPYLEHKFGGRIPALQDEGPAVLVAISEIGLHDNYERIIRTTVTAAESSRIVVVERNGLATLSSSSAAQGCHKSRLLTETIILRPLREFYLTDHRRFGPMTTLHFGASQLPLPTTQASWRKTKKGAFFSTNIV